MFTKRNDISDVQLKILVLFIQGFERPYYIREIAKVLKISSRTAYLALQTLEKKTIIKSEERGKIKQYILNKKSSLCYEYLIFTELYKRIHFYSDHFFIEELMEKIKLHVHGILILFGSYVKGTATKESDIDLFVIGSYDDKKISDVFKIYNKEGNIKAYPLHVFEKNIKTDYLIKEVLSNHIIIKGADEFISLVKAWQQ